MIHLALCYVGFAITSLQQLTHSKQGHNERWKERGINSKRRYKTFYFLLRESPGSFTLGKWGTQSMKKTFSSPWRLFWPSKKYVWAKKKLLSTINQSLKIVEIDSLTVFLSFFHPPCLSLWNESPLAIKGLNGGEEERIKRRLLSTCQVKSVIQSVNVGSFQRRHFLLRLSPFFTSEVEFLLRRSDVLSKKKVFWPAFFCKWVSEGVFVLPGV